jgi:NTP pyrophosphatase (non-canonical NTP hydrolase)
MVATNEVIIMEKIEMTLNEYQNKAMTTCMDTCENFSYMMLNLVGEVGELASKVAKDIRRGAATIEHSRLNFASLADLEMKRGAQGQELGDILWMLAGLAKVYGYSLEEIARMNLEKLAARKAAGTIEGEGDGIYNR